MASALGAPAPEADPQVLVAGSAATLPLALNAAPLLRSAVAPAVAVQTPAVVATPAFRTIATPAFPAPLLKSAPCVNAANVPVPCADIDADFAVPAVARAALPLAAPVARTVVAAPTPIARTVVAAPAPIARTVVAAPAPVVRTAVPAPLPLARAPVVAARTRPVTYTHLGAHPINPTTVLETEQVLL